MTNAVMNETMSQLDLTMDALEGLEAPGFWSTAGGVAAGVVVGGGLVYLGGALALT
ncbi:hypothetical protein MHY29_03575 [Micrococcus sp. ACRRV]|uniref:hypothetical protein n=1 Tax=Micrococcus sp. ACRRV TaxID=2918203 RepID=UPI001EF1647B|nr:hypothetical protein [Micrococcus sp. ACRRV]MCG7421922.1 hypothetical protein [Micrococcus sp. ACRRV]